MSLEWNLSRNYFLVSLWLDSKTWYLACLQLLSPFKWQWGWWYWPLPILFSENSYILSPCNSVGWVGGYASASLVDTIQTAVLVQSLSNFPCKLLMMREETFLIFGHGVKVNFGTVYKTFRAWYRLQLLPNHFQTLTMNRVSLALIINNLHHMKFESDRAKLYPPYMISQAVSQPYWPKYQ